MKTKRNVVTMEVMSRGGAMYRARITPGNPLTLCEIQVQREPIIDEPEYWSLRAYGMSVCRDGDAYDEETGLRKALASALRKINDKDLRGAFWHIYLGLYPPQDRVEPERVIYKRYPNWFDRGLIDTLDAVRFSFGSHLVEVDHA